MNRTRSSGSSSVDRSKIGRTRRWNPLDIVRVPDELVIQPSQGASEVLLGSAPASAKYVAHLCMLESAEPMQIHDALEARALRFETLKCMGEVQ